MTRVVLDSSTFLAYVNKKPGGAAVGALLVGALVCSVNACEIATKLFESGKTVTEVRYILENAGFKIVDFDLDLAVEAGGMVTLTKSRGLSLGDRACLALAAREGLPALTSDRAWKDVDVGAAIEFVR